MTQRSRRIPAASVFLDRPPGRGGTATGGRHVDHRSRTRSDRTAPCRFACGWRGRATARNCATCWTTRPAPASRCSPGWKAPARPCWWRRARWDSWALPCCSRASCRCPAPGAHKVVEVDNLVVRADLRGRRIGRRLLAAAVEWSRQRRAVQVEAVVGDVNRDGRRFYESFGFARGQRSARAGGVMSTPVRPIVRPATLRDYRALCALFEELDEFHRLRAAGLLPPLRRAGADLGAGGPMAGRPGLDRSGRRG